MEEIKKGYHITEKSKLYNIQKNGLQPRRGRRSNDANEPQKLVCFSTQLDDAFIWKNKLYEKSIINKNSPNKDSVSFDDLAILVFDLDNIQYIERSPIECFTKDTILPENISLIEITPKDKSQKVDSLDEIFSSNLLLDLIERMKKHYDISMKPITEIQIENPILDDDKNRKSIEKLASYEHKKWSEVYHIVNWRSKKCSDGSSRISDEDMDGFHGIKKYIGVDYDDVEDFYKKYMREAVMETFFIMQENNISDNLGISDEELISVLERTEYMRRNRWNEYMLSACSIEDGEYFIPAQKAQLWKEEMETPYDELTEEQKESCREEVQNIFLEIQRYKSAKEDKTPLQKREDILTKLEKEEEILESLIELSKQSEKSSNQR